MGQPVVYQAQPMSCMATQPQGYSMGQPVDYQAAPMASMAPMPPMASQAPVYMSSAVGQPRAGYEAPMQPDAQAPLFAEPMVPGLAQPVVYQTAPMPCSAPAASQAPAQFDPQQGAPIACGMD